MIDRVPKIWKWAYLLICIWYAINFLISAIFEYNFVNPAAYVLWNAFFLFEALCVFIILIFLWSHWLSRFPFITQVVSHVGGLIVFFFIMGTLSYYFTDYMDGLIYFEHWKEYMIDLMSWDALRIYDQYIITVGIYYIISYFEGLQRKEREKSQLAIKNREMQISLLKSQINPHFLFNTLNSISTLIHSSKEQARKVITQLSDIFRYALDAHGGEMVSLLHEIDFIENYIRIQQVRFGGRLRFQKEIDPACYGVQLPPMILQPLIENSVKYGIAPKEEGGTIGLVVRRESKTIYFEVWDDGLGIHAKKVMDGFSSTGVGIKNTDQRLKSYFGARSGLRIRSHDQGYSVSFYLPDRPKNKDEKKEVRIEKIKI